MFDLKKLKIQDKHLIDQQYNGKHYDAIVIGGGSGDTVIHKVFSKGFTAYCFIRLVLNNSTRTFENP